MQSGYGRFVAGLSLALAVAFGAGPAAAAATDEPLEADKAFRATARLVAGPPAAADRHGIDVEYRIEPGYYLYRDRLRFEVLPALLVAAPEFPRGEEIDDPFLGKSVIFREKATIHLPFTASAVKPGQYRVRITAQGCAENRLCYAPFVQELPLNIPPGYRMLDSGTPPRSPLLPR